MVIPFDIRNSWKYVPVRETVLYFRRTAEGTFDPTDGAEVLNCKRTPLQKSMGGGDSLLEMADVALHIWMSQLQNAGFTAQPKFGDKWKDADGYYYQVLHVDVLALKTRFRLACKQEKT